MDIISVEIGKILPNSWNPKTESLRSKQGMARIGKSLSRHGQVTPLLVRRLGDGYELVNGHHRLQAMAELGYEKVSVVDLGEITEDRAKAIALATEDTNIPLDRILSSALVKSLLEEDTLNVSFTPYEREEAESMAELASFDWEMEKPQRQSKQSKKGLRVEIPFSLIRRWEGLLKASKCPQDEELLISLMHDYGN